MVLAVLSSSSLLTPLRYAFDLNLFSKAISFYAAIKYLSGLTKIDGCKSYLRSSRTKNLLPDYYSYILAKS